MAINKAVGEKAILYFEDKSGVSLAPVIKKNEGADRENPDCSCEWQTWRRTGHVGLLAIGKNVLPTKEEKGEL